MEQGGHSSTEPPPARAVPLQGAGLLHLSTPGARVPPESTMPKTTPCGGGDAAPWGSHRPQRCPPAGGWAEEPPAPGGCAMGQPHTEPSFLPLGPTAPAQQGQAEICSTHTGL